jgi:hypothetical protein
MPHVRSIPWFSLLALSCAWSCGTAGGDPQTPPYTDEPAFQGEVDAGGATTAPTPVDIDPSPPPPVSELDATPAEVGAGEGESADSSVPFPACAATTQKAQPVPVDVYFVLDASGSMSDLVAAQKSKWSAVVAAMTDLVGDPRSIGMNVGLELFPRLQAGVPATCTSNADCGAAGPCFLGVCNDASGLPCADNSDCDGASACVPVGTCELDPNQLCNPGGDCGVDGNGFDLGGCQSLPTSSCADGDSCSPSDYSTPDVPIGALPGASTAFLAALSGHSPQGGTPTLAALSAGLETARQNAIAHPDHLVTVVLATDGVPDETGDGRSSACTGVDLATANAAVTQAVSAAFAGSPGIRTFALGVFTPDSEAMGDSVLEAIAAAGGTSQPYIVTTSGTDSGPDGVETQLVAALDQIRGDSLPCRFGVPVPQTGTADFGRVNVRVTSAGATSTVAYVEAGAACGPAGGWYYDADPAEGGVPRFIELCAATCGEVESDPSASVDLALGCATTLP